MILGTTSNTRMYCIYVGSVKYPGKFIILYRLNLKYLLMVHVVFRII